ncbi:hypothetical protein DRN85_07695 [Methanosarcinales archaeon]|nr:MAG: hypothetical protein DRN85_07695 [Methanosarcinales archaeon]
MKVVLTGPACAGKSTLLRNLEWILSERGYRVKVFNEIARDYIKNAKHIQQHKLEEKLFRLYLRRYQEMEEEIADIYLLDRDLTDVLFYTLLYDRQPEAISLAEEIMLAISKHHADVYFLLSPLRTWDPRGRLVFEGSIEVREWELIFWRDWLTRLFPRGVFIIDIDLKLVNAEEVANLIEIYYKILKKQERNE